MLAREDAQVFRQELHDGRHIGVDAYMAAHAIGVLGQLALHALQAIQHVARVVQQAFAGRSECHATAVAIQQGRVHGGLEVGQALAHRRSGDELALCRSSDAAKFADSHEQLQGGKVYAPCKTAL